MIEIVRNNVFFDMFVNHIIIEVANNLFVLQKIVEAVKMTADTTKDIEVKFSSDCKEFKSTGVCSDVHVGDVLNFTATIEAKECMREGKKIIKIHPHALEQSLVVELDIQCQCNCSLKNSSTYEERSENCSGQGDLTCGVCQCLSGRFGKTCQCDKTNSQSEDTATCKMKGSNDTCSGINIAE